MGNRKKPEIDDVIEQGFFPSKQGLSRVMSHQIAIVNHARVIFLDQSKASHFFFTKKVHNCETFFVKLGLMDRFAVASFIYK